MRLLVTNQQLATFAAYCASAGCCFFAFDWFYQRWKSIPPKPVLDFMQSTSIHRAPCDVLVGNDVVVRKTVAVGTRDTYTTLHIQKSNSSSSGFDALTDQSVVKCSRFDHESKVCNPSPKDVSQRYMRLMMSAFALVPQPLATNLNVLCLGMGAGVLPAFIQESFPHHLKVLDIVEIEPQVVVAASKYMGYYNRSEAQVDIHIQDGDIFVTNTKNKYDVMLVDVFVGNDMPSHTATSAFFAACHAALARHGVLTMNIHKNELLKPIMENAGIVFGANNVYQLPCGNDGNVVLLACKLQPKGRLTQRHLVKRCSEFSKTYKLPFDVGNHLPLYWLI